MSVNSFSALGFLPRQEETLYWSAGRRLQFSDFRGRPVKETKIGTEQRGHGGIAGTIIKSIVADTRKINGRTYFVVYASMKPKLSWINKKRDSTALRHEQGHFDICEIYARRLRQEIGGTASIAQAKRLWNDVLDAEEREQTRYDKANTYLAGGITATWAGKIAGELKALDAYANPQIAAGKMN